MSYAVILENTSDHVALRTTVKVRMKGASGKPLKDDDASDELDVSLIMPGERAAVADTTYVDGAGGIRELEARTGSSEWLPNRAADPQLSYGTRLAELAVSDVSVEPARSWTTVAFRVDSEHSEPLATGAVVVVFRDSKGSLIGGDNARHGWGDVYPPGWSKRQVSVDYLPSNIDEDRTKVYLSADCC